MTIEALSLSDLPAVGEQLGRGTFAGITTLEDGSHAATLLLPVSANDLTWEEAISWALGVGGQLPAPAVASLLYARLRDHVLPAWHWTSTTDGCIAAYIQFDGGSLGWAALDVPMSVIAVALVPLSGA